MSKHCSNPLFKIWNKKDNRKCIMSGWGSLNSGINSHHSASSSSCWNPHHHQNKTGMRRASRSVVACQSASLCYLQIVFFVPIRNIIYVANKIRASDLDLMGNKYDLTAKTDAQDLHVYRYKGCPFFPPFLSPLLNSNWIKRPLYLHALTEYCMHRFRLLVKGATEPPYSTVNIKQASDMQIWRTGEE